ncbi:hypothetical protein [Corynebacterium cystitidis]|uniref:Uncharacterized protein n=1 Tax=Corynebacterium cystitidis DSM 20524 TaxID=1121357 RepID=A0A1H9WKF3_9CORY|nr:hypothetical protein [Corynebacterium cystitidis]WJY83427.1 hypothetical protein CCYS_12700 [Corynebacterium cystitidis DSM 20524]SES34360.1 hypothetical protein SAMN05661109_02785 [Corynebacterium cystitidis DSM 20524]SNV61743.1 Uncharacterised protein [Corynebacterium cystitidis]
MLAWLYKPTIFNQDPSDYPLFEISQRWARDGFSQVPSMVEISPALGNGATVVA